MKNIQDILKKKSSVGARQKRGPLEEKTIARLFLEAAKVEIPGLGDADIREIKLKNSPASSREASRAGKTLYIKTAHPVISSELFLRKEKILAKINELAGRKEIEDLRI